MTPELAAAIKSTAANIGADPVDLGTAISYETAGTFNPWQKGPTTQWGEHRGLIQWGEPQRKQYGIYEGMPVEEQMQAVGKYLVDRGYQPGMGMMDLYSAINAGRVGKYNASDANNGGAPGTVTDKVNSQMAGHRTKAQQFLGMASQPGAVPAVASAMPAGIGAMPGASAEAEKDDSGYGSQLASLQQQLAALTQPKTQADLPPMMRRAAQPFDRTAISSLLKRRA